HRALWPWRGGFPPWCGNCVPWSTSGRGRTSWTTAVHDVSWVWTRLRGTRCAGEPRASISSFVDACVLGGRGELIERGAVDVVAQIVFEIVEYLGVGGEVGKPFDIAADRILGAHLDFGHVIGDGKRRFGHGVGQFHGLVIAGDDLDYQLAVHLRPAGRLAKLRMPLVAAVCQPPDPIERSCDKHLPRDSWHERFLQTTTG